MMKQAARLLIWGLLTIGVFCTSGFSTAQAETTEDRKENYTYLLKNPNQVNKFLKELNLDEKNVKVTVIEEIGLIYIENIEEDENLEQELAPYSQKLAGYVAAEGKLPELEPVLEEPNVTDVSDIKAEIQEIEEIQNLPLTSPYFAPFNWYLEDVTNQYQSHLINKGEGTSIALLDSGIDQNHPLLVNQIDFNLGKNYTTSDEHDVSDEMGHGTSVAGILASIAPDAEIVPYKVMGAESGESVWVLEAIIDAANDGNDVINMSLGTYKYKDNEEDSLFIKAYELAVRYADRKGVLVVSSSGNLAKDLDAIKKNGEIYLPGNLKNVITVSSNSNQDTLASYSNYGKSVDFSAPGGDLDENFDITGLILTTYPMDKPNTFLDQVLGIPQGYTLNMGTSLSAPQVSATAALIISEFKEINGKELKAKRVVKYLRDGASDLGKRGFDPYFGYGKINAYQSLMSL